MALLIPERLVNFRIYGGAAKNEMLGVTDLTLPDFDALTDKISGAGIAGEIDSVVIGHFGSQVLNLKWRALTKAGITGLMAPVPQVLDCRASVQSQDKGNSSLVTDAWRVEVRGMVKTFKLGKLEPGKQMDTSSDVEVQAITISNAGMQLVQLDKLNMIYIVGGVDYLQKVRIDLGGV